MCTIGRLLLLLRIFLARAQRNSRNLLCTRQSERENITFANQSTDEIVPEELQRKTQAILTLKKVNYVKMIRC